MKKLSDIIKCNIRNIIFDESILEDLNNLVIGNHGKDRSNDQTKNETTPIAKSELINIIKKCDSIITDSLLNKKLKEGSQFGILKLLKWPDKCLAMVLIVQNFNVEKCEYDLFVKTVNKLRDRIFKFKDVDLVIDVDTSGYAKLRH